jgi:hypothetical protein
MIHVICLNFRDFLHYDTFQSVISATFADTSTSIQYDTNWSVFTSRVHDIWDPYVVH